MSPSSEFLRIKQSNCVPGAYPAKLASMNVSGGQVCAALSFTTLPRGFMISGRRLDPGSEYGVGWLQRLSEADTPQMLFSA